MKKILVVLMVLLCSRGFCQKNDSSLKQQNESLTFIIDSIRVAPNILKYIDYSDLFMINVVTDPRNPTNMICYASFRDYELFIKMMHSKLLSLKEITDSNINNLERNQPVLYVVDNQLLTDTVGVRIPSLCLTKVTVLKASATPYLKSILPTGFVLTITTKKIATPKVIRIKGLASNQ